MKTSNLNQNNYPPRKVSENNFETPSKTLINYVNVNNLNENNLSASPSS